MSELYQTLLSLKEEFHPLFLPDLDAGNTYLLDFSSANRSLEHMDFGNPSQVHEFIARLLKTHGKKYGYGGYMENRNLYKVSDLFFNKQDEVRNIHLGVDIWAEAGEQVYAPLQGKVHSFKNNDRLGDYGPTIILEHQIKEHRFFTLYGHLSPESLERLFQGLVIKHGEPFCSIGNFPANGNWPPHLHFQVIGDMMGFQGDYPGVCHSHEVNTFEQICPDPKLFFDNLFV
jgi:murein DD-endopeptidase MepM/ murein hydrolase activator NlpD